MFSFMRKENALIVYLDRVDRNGDPFICIQEELCLVSTNLNIQLPAEIKSKGYQVLHAVDVVNTDRHVISLANGRDFELISKIYTLPGTL